MGKHTYGGEWKGIKCTANWLSDTKLYRHDKSMKGWLNFVKCESYNISILIYVNINKIKSFLFFLFLIVFPSYFLSGEKAFVDIEIKGFVDGRSSCVSYKHVFDF